MNNAFHAIRAISVAALVALTFMPQPVLADILMTSGDSCNIQNFGGDAARAGSRKQGGAYYNISTGFNFTVSCPLIIDHDFNNYDVAVRFGNGGSVTQKFQCTLAEYDPFDNKLRSLVRTIDIPPGISAGVFWERISLGHILNRLYMVCNLPPQSAMGTLLTQSYVP